MIWQIRFRPWLVERILFPARLECGCLIFRESVAPGNRGEDRAALIFSGAIVADMLMYIFRLHIGLNRVFMPMLQFPATLLAASPGRFLIRKKLTDLSDAVIRYADSTVR